MENKTAKKQTQKETSQEAINSTCGIIMPISSIDGCSSEHWQEVKNILFEAIKISGYEPNLVSDSNDSGVIQKRIVQNIYDNEIIICDVSCKNPNVMFELGMRLAFDKPTIVIIDDKTNYSFDTAPIEHLTYPRDLSYYEVLKFKDRLSEKIKGTIEAAKAPGYTTFLKHFGEFKVAEIDEKEGTINDFLLDRLSEFSNKIDAMGQVIMRQNVISKVPIDINQLRTAINEVINSYCTKSNINRDSINQNDASFKDIIQRVRVHPLVRHMPISMDIIQREVNLLLPLF